MNKLGEHLGIKDVYGCPIKVGDSVDIIEFYRGNTYLSRVIVLGLTKGKNARTGFLVEHKGQKYLHVSWTPSHKLMLSPNADAKRCSHSETNDTDKLRNQYNRLYPEHRAAFLKNIKGADEHVDLT